jgi:hypothetical protein
LDHLLAVIIHLIDMAVDIGRARVYGGIHYTYSCVEGNKQASRIAQNILNILKFRKDE